MMLKNFASLRERIEVKMMQAKEGVEKHVLTEENRTLALGLVAKARATVEEFVDESRTFAEAATKSMAEAQREHEEADLRGAVIDLTYVTDRFIAMAMPRAGAARRGRASNPVAAVAHHLRTYHDGHYMVLNVSEESYDYACFEQQVLEFKFPGHPAPPLGMLFKMCASIESWLEADPENVVAVHCLTGRGRTSVVMACAMAWLGLFETPFEALAHVARRRGEDVEKMSIPSQRRYVQYFANVLDGVAPRSEPLVLRRVIMHAIPDLRGTNDSAVQPPAGCCPYLQFFKGGELAYSTTWTGAQGSGGVEPWAAQDDGPLVFNVDCVVHGDVLVRCRHLARDGARTSMFRAALHAGYAPAGVVRLTKAQLDGACADSRFPDDFFIDLIFSPLDDDASAAPAPEPAAAASTPPQPPKKAVELAAYDQLLHKDSRFWREVHDRKQRAQRRRLAAAQPRPDAAAGRSLDAQADGAAVKGPVQRAAAGRGPVFAIGDAETAAARPVPAVEAPPQPTAAETAAFDTDDLLQQLAEADAYFSAAAPAEVDDAALDDALDAQVSDAPPSESPPSESPPPDSPPTTADVLTAADGPAPPSTAVEVSTASKAVDGPAPETAGSADEVPRAAEEPPAPPPVAEVVVATAAADDTADVALEEPTTDVALEESDVDSRSVPDAQDVDTLAQDFGLDALEQDFGFSASDAPPSEGAAGDDAAFDIDDFESYLNNLK
ncbi:hypothetical protein M885DRAFT_611384 [Pelagophyceae sp. CCMP2097]|nr:hypothetical protein M885DRAFT_611384 [Pelagophyceae sp. CCMP2097]